MFYNYTIKTKKGRKMKNYLIMVSILITVYGLGYSQDNQIKNVSTEYMQIDE